MNKTDAYNSAVYWEKQRAAVIGTPRARFYKARKQWYQAQMRAAHKAEVNAYYASVTATPSPQIEAQASTTAPVAIPPRVRARNMEA